MFIFLKKQIKNQRGDILIGVVALAICAGIIAMIFRYQSQISKDLNSIIKDPIVNLEFHSATETLLYAYYHEETTYYLKIAQNNCLKAKPFIQALKSGSGCNIDIKLFSSDTLTSPLFKTYTGCTISINSTACGGIDTSKPFGPIQILSINKNSTDTLNPFTSNSFDFYLFSLVPEKQYLEFLTTISTLDQKLSKTFAIKNTVDNFAHIEAYGGVSQENPNPLARCSGTAWGVYNVFNSETLECMTFSLLGGGTGLAFYNDRFFSFRPSDGQVFDLYSASTTNTFLVDESGKLGAVSVFPPYSRNLLMNTDDITVIGTDIYYVAGSSDNAHIGYIDLALDKQVRVCELGTLGWGQMYAGIAATSRSQTITNLKSEASATFFVKTDTGDLLTVVVSVSAGAYVCSVVKDINIQQIEYKRTYGFDRVQDQPQVYYY